MKNQTIAILGASSHIARDLILSFAAAGYGKLLLYVRDLASMQAWLKKHLLSANDFQVLPYDLYGDIPHAAVINCVGVGDPSRALEMGRSIFDVTQYYDNLALAGLKSNTDRRYIFLSSGAVYGRNFSEPVHEDSISCIPMNSFTSSDWYSVAKLYSEALHRSHKDLSIVDVRIFNYISESLDLSTSFFISQILRSIKNKDNLVVSSENITRDYISASDFFRLIEIIISHQFNDVLDCYSASPISKIDLLQAMQRKFGLNYEISASIDANTKSPTGKKANYFSLNRRAKLYGYSPEFTSIDGISRAASQILQRNQ